MSGWHCNECNKHVNEPLRIKLFSTLGEMFHLAVCPHCRRINSSLVKCCDEPGCKNAACMGTPTKGGGYRNTCAEHAPKDAP
jgi:hypothetical protein